ncbi:MAG: hypothetical protein O7I42_21595 [Alphaproteobacteria bacterium]|nr:hypothetical protein [Alphaproteobacteria bacterium]
MTYALSFFALIGVAATAILVVGLYRDISDFDRTRGGYEAPFTGVTGEPVDWYSLDRTPTGFAKRGHVVNVLVDGTTGMISFEIFKHKIDIRPLSERAKVVHKPREAFIAMGFEPEF